MIGDHLAIGISTYCLALAGLRCGGRQRQRSWVAGNEALTHRNWVLENRQGDWMPGNEARPCSNRSLGQRLRPGSWEPGNKARTRRKRVLEATEAQRARRCFLPRQRDCPWSPERDCGRLRSEERGAGPAKTRALYWLGCSRVVCCRNFRSWERFSTPASHCMRL